MPLASPPPPVTATTPWSPLPDQIGSPSVNSCPIWTGQVAKSIYSPRRTRRLPDNCRRRTCAPLKLTAKLIVPYFTFISHRHTKSAPLKSILAADDRFCHLTHRNRARIDWGEANLVGRVFQGSGDHGGGGRERGRGGGKNGTNSYADFFSLSQFACLWSIPHRIPIQTAKWKVHASDWNVHVVTQFC